MDYKFTFEDGSEAIAHYGVLGMHWGVRNNESLARMRRALLDSAADTSMTSIDRALLKSAESVVNEMIRSENESKKRMEEEAERNRVEDEKRRLKAEERAREYAREAEERIRQDREEEKARIEKRRKIIEEQTRKETIERERQEQEKKQAIKSSLEAARHDPDAALDALLNYGNSAAPRVKWEPDYMNAVEEMKRMKKEAERSREAERNAQLLEERMRQNKENERQMSKDAMYALLEKAAADADQDFEATLRQVSEENERRNRQLQSPDDYSRRVSNRAFGHPSMW